MTTFEAISTNPNSWTNHSYDCSDGSTYTVTQNEQQGNCGHNHKTIAAAVRCSKRWDGTTFSLHVEIERSDGDRMIDADGDGNYESDRDLARAEHRCWQQREAS